jgi:tetratricopeptide (TPR) repeat protein
MLADTAAQHPSDSTVIALARALSKRAGNPQRTLAAYLKQIEAQPTELNHYLNAVRLLQIAGEHQRAEGLLQNAAKAIPNDYRVSLALGRLYLHARRDGLAGASEKARQALIVALNQCQDEAAKKEISKLLAHATR